MNKRIALTALLGLFAFTTSYTTINAMDEGTGADHTPSKEKARSVHVADRPTERIFDAASGHHYKRDGACILNQTTGKQYLDPACLDWKTTKKLIRQLRDNIDWQSGRGLMELRNYLQTKYCHLKADTSLMYAALYFAKVASITLLESLYATKFKDDIRYFTLQQFLPVAYCNTSSKTDFFRARRDQFMRAIDESPGPVKNVKRRMMDKILAQMP